MFSLLYQDKSVELMTSSVVNDVKEASKYTENVVMHIHTYTIDKDDNEIEELCLLRTLPSKFDLEIEGECTDSERPKHPLFLTKFTRISDVVNYVLGNKKSECNGDSGFIVKIRYRSKQTMIPIHKSNLQNIRLADLPRENCCGFGTCVDLHVYLYTSDCILDDE